MDLCKSIRTYFFLNIYNLFIFLRYGNWIFVNSAQDRETLAILNDKKIQPDDVVVLQDTGAQLEALQKRWYKANRTEIDKEIREREEREANERRIQEEERK
jgi:hypothetical protein